ncbi:MAG TPA: hypothetical protein VMQ59_05330 [Acidimicrobiales bacterium]|jgi:hypothetical protein|nr:hypothetical protein [Acidimicrobiales bacterium]
MQTLVVAIEYPWPVESGSRLRLLTTMHAPYRGQVTDVAQGAAAVSPVALAGL